MFRILDRYIVREIVMPFLLGLTVLTFILVLPPILQRGEDFIAKGVEFSIVARALLTLLPQALCVTIPMAVLLGILVGMGRLSADREFVAMQACGVSLLRLARPVLLVAALATGATAYETIVALPNANSTFQEIVLSVTASKVEHSVRPHVFFDTFPNKIIYVRELPPEGGWRDVFLADTSKPAETTVFFARAGHIRMDRAKRIVQLELEDGSGYTTHADKPDACEVNTFEKNLLTLDPDAVFRQTPTRGAKEMTAAELRKEIAEAAKRGEPAYDARFMIQQKLSLPLACPVLALIGLALGATSRKDGKLAGFAIGMGVILIYYVLLFGSRAAALGGRLNAEWAPWAPNIILGLVGIAMMVWRARVADQPIRFSIPAFWRRSSDAAPHAAQVRVAPRVVVVIRIPQFHVPRPKLLDIYLSREYIRIFLLGLVSLLGVFYIATLIDLVDKLFRGETDGTTLLSYFYFRTPQFVYYVIPMGVLVSTLVTVGVMTKTGELLVMRACGISLYRTVAPLVLFGLFGSGLLFLLQERVLASANRQADQLERVIRHYPPALNAINRRWIIGTRGEMYHYDFFDTSANRFSNLLIYKLDDQAWRPLVITRAADATAVMRNGADGQPQQYWAARQGWTRELSKTPAADEAEAVVAYTPFADRDLRLEPPNYFKAEEPIAELMTYAQLRDYITRLSASGANVVPQMVELQRKIAFPFVTVIMTLLAVPFAVTTGRRGAMYGIGIGIVLAITYWVTMSVSGALGAGGVLTPLLAAWAPNILFGAAAVYMMLTVRT